MFPKHHPLKVALQPSLGCPIFRTLYQISIGYPLKFVFIALRMKATFWFLKKNIFRPPSKASKNSIFGIFHDFRPILALNTPNTQNRQKYKKETPSNF